MANSVVGKMADDAKIKDSPQAEKCPSETTIITATTTDLEKGEPEAVHPRDGMPAWKWPATLAILVSLTLINGTFSDA